MARSREVDHTALLHAGYAQGDQGGATAEDASPIFEQGLESSRFFSTRNDNRSSSTFGRAASNARTDADHRHLLNTEFHGDRVGSLEADASDIACQFSVIIWMASEP